MSRQLLAWSTARGRKSGNSFLSPPNAISGGRGGMDLGVRWIAANVVAATDRATHKFSFLAPTP